MLFDLTIFISAPFGGAASFALFRRLPLRRLSLSGWVSGGEESEQKPSLSDFVPFKGWSRHGIGRTKAALESMTVLVTLWALTVSDGSAAFATAGLGWALVTLAALDLYHRLLPDALTLPLTVAGLVIAPTLIATGTPHHLVGAMIGGGTLWAVAVLVRAVTGRDGLGLGDAKLFMAAGAWLGWVGLPSALFIGALGGLLHGILSKTARKEVPFGAWLAAGIWLTWLYGPAGFP